MVGQFLHPFCQVIAQPANPSVRSAAVQANRLRTTSRRTGTHHHSILAPACRQPARACWLLFAQRARFGDVIEILEARSLSCPEHDGRTKIVLSPISSPTARDLQLSKTPYLRRSFFLFSLTFLRWIPSHHSRGRLGVTRVGTERLLRWQSWLWSRASSCRTPAVSRPPSTCSYFGRVSIPFSHTRLWSFLRLVRVRPGLTRPGRTRTRPGDGESGGGRARIIDKHAIEYMVESVATDAVS